MTEPQRDAKAIAEELAALLGREQADSLLEKARAPDKGASTSEFRLAALGAVIGLSLVVIATFKATPELADRGIELIQWSVAGYAVSRGIAKAGAAKAK